MLQARLREAREAKGWTRYRLTKQAQLKGSHVSWLEDYPPSEQPNPSGDTLRRIAAALDVTVDWLLGSDEGGPKAAEPDTTDTTVA